MFKTSMIGYDARELWLDPKYQWTDEKKKSYLLRNDLSKPLSVDKYVWYSVFGERNQPHLWQDIPRKQIYMTSVWENTFSSDRILDYPDVYSPRSAWTNLDSLLEYLTGKWQDNWKPCAIVAIEEVLFDDEDEVESVMIQPNSIDKDWQFLGYDVADYDLYTGLTDPEIKPELTTQIKTNWVNDLNKYHLFNDSQVASDYIEFANLRNPTHRPFGIYGLYLAEVKGTNEFP